MNKNLQTALNTLIANLTSKLVTMQTIAGYSERGFEWLPADSQSRYADKIRVSPLTALGVSEGPGKGKESIQMVAALRSRVVRAPYFRKGAEWHRFGSQDCCLEQYKAVDSFLVERL